jgi:hypothetical protein
MALSPRDTGFVVGVLVGEGHFGGDGRQPHVTLRMHTRHEATLRRVHDAIPGSRLFGPYHHGGRHYFQLMVRGLALRETLVPLLHQNRDLLDEHVAARFDAMCVDYGLPAPGD